MRGGALGTQPQTTVVVEAEKGPLGGGAGVAVETESALVGGGRLHLSISPIFSAVLDRSCCDQFTTLQAACPGRHPPLRHPPVTGYQPPDPYIKYFTTRQAVLRSAAPVQAHFGRKDCTPPGDQLF